MKEEEIVESNKLIAEFMGATPCKDAWGQDAMEHHDWDHEEWSNGIKDYFETHSYKMNNLKYHSSWDWLMSVVEKIELLLFPNDNWINVNVGTSKYCTIFDSNGDTIEIIGEEETKIKSTWVAVVEFIKWYNENKSN